MDAPEWRTRDDYQIIRSPGAVGPAVTHPWIVLRRCRPGDDSWEGAFRARPEVDRFRRRLAVASRFATEAEARAALDALLEEK